MDLAIPASAPTLGPEGAPVTIVEFTDYQCPFCHRAQATIDQVMSTYAGKVQLVHRDFPLEGHPQAFPAARASRCAGEQGTFWDYHRSLMGAPGRKTVKAAPPSGRFAALRVPPWASTKRCEMGRPRPVPPARRVKNGSKMRSRSAGASPGPSSATVRLTPRGGPSRARAATRTVAPRGECWTALASRF